MLAQLSKTAVFYVGNFLCPRDFICYEFCALLYIILLKPPNMVKNNPANKNNDAPLNFIFNYRANVSYHLSQGSQT